MNIERLQELWKNQSATLPPLPDDAALLAKIKGDSAEFDLTIRRRDRRELWAGLKYAGFFAALSLVPAARGEAWSFAVAAGSMAGVMLFLLGEKILATRSSRGLPRDTLLDELSFARREVGRQIWLLRNVAWWYVLPAQAAWWFFGFGIARVFPWTIPLPGVIGLMACWTYFLWRGAVDVCRLNREAVEKSLVPRLKELDAIATGLAESDIPDDDFPSAP